MSFVRFIMAVGLPGSGKSTLYRNLYPNTEYISSDSIREEVFGDVNDQSHNAEVFNIMYQRTCAALKEHKSVYYDATNISAKRRMNFLKEISYIPNVCKICALVASPLEVVKERNSQRERKVPEHVIDRMLKSFEVPHQSEGWDYILIYGTQSNKEKLEDLLQIAKGIPHDNPHHTLSIGEHMLEAEKYYLEHGTHNVKHSAPAARYHDIGKLYCKVFRNSKNQPTIMAHYYSHENVGAYIYLSYSDGYHGHATDHSYALYNANLILHHMDRYKGEKYMEKIRSRFSKTFIEDLELLYEADMAAH